MSSSNRNTDGLLTTPFWDGCRQGELRVQHCPVCGRYQFYPRPHCLGCGRREPEWVATSGRGVVTAYTRVHVPLNEAWADHVPYWVALVRLDEGPTLMTNLIDTEEACVGMPVTVQFRSRVDGKTLPLFAPASVPTVEKEDEP